MKTNLTSFYISLTGDTVKFLFRFKWLVKRGLRAPFLFVCYGDPYAIHLFPKRASEYQLAPITIFITPATRMAQMFSSENAKCVMS